MPPAHSTSFARREARPLEAGLLAADQKRAWDGILVSIRRMAQAPYTPPSPPSAEEAFVVRVDEERNSQTLLIHGERGTGKTSVMLSVLQEIEKSWRPPTKAARGADHAPSMVLPLPIIDLALIQAGLSSDLLVGARLQQLVEYLNDTARSRCGEDSEDLSLEDRWDRFVAIAAGQNIREEVLTGTSLHERVEQLRKLAIQGIDRATRFGMLIDAVHAAARKRWGINLFLLVTVDDAEVHTDRVGELLRTLRALQHPRLAFLVAGDLELFQRAMEVKLEKDLPAGKDPYLVPRLAAQGLERVFPQGQRFPVRLLPLTERLELPAIDLRGLLGKVKVPAFSEDAKAGLGTFATLLDDPLLCRILPDRLRTLEDWYQALRAGLDDSAMAAIGEAAAEKETEESNKRRAREKAIGEAQVAVVLRTLWEILLEHREQHPRARDLLRRRLGLNWISGDRLTLDPRGLQARWGADPLKEITVDDGSEAVGRVVKVGLPVLEQMTLELPALGLSHPLSESVSLMALLTLEVGVSMGWCTEDGLRALLPSQAWIACVVSVDDTDFRFSWPTPAMTSLVRHVLPLSRVLRDLRGSDDGEDVGRLATIWAHHLANPQTAWNLSQGGAGDLGTFDTRARADKDFVSDAFDRGAAQFNFPHLGRSGRWGELVIEKLREDLRRVKGDDDLRLLLDLAKAWKVPTTSLAIRPMNRVFKSLAKGSPEWKVSERLVATPYRSALCEAVSAAEWEAIEATLLAPGSVTPIQALCAPLSPAQRAAVVHYWLWRDEPRGLSRLTMQADPDLQGNPHAALVELIALVHADLVAEELVAEIPRVPMAVVGKALGRRRLAVAGPLQSNYPGDKSGLNWPGYLVRVRKPGDDQRVMRGVPVVPPKGLLGVERLVSVWNECLAQQRSRKEPCDTVITRWFLSLAALSLVPEAWDRTEGLVFNGPVIAWSGVPDAVQSISMDELGAFQYDSSKSYFALVLSLLVGSVKGRVRRRQSVAWGQFLDRFEEWLSQPDNVPGGHEETVEAALEAVRALKDDRAPKE